METTANSTDPASASSAYMQRHINRSPMFKGLTPDGQRAFAQEALDQSFLVRQLAAVRNGIPDAGYRNVIEDVSMNVEKISTSSERSHTESNVTATSGDGNTASATSGDGNTAATSGGNASDAAVGYTFEPEPLPPLWPTIRNILLWAVGCALLTLAVIYAWRWWHTPTPAADRPCIICETDEDLDEYVRSLGLEPITNEFDPWAEVLESDE